MNSRYPQAGLRFAPRNRLHCWPADSVFMEEIQVAHLIVALHEVVVSKLQRPHRLLVLIQLLCRCKASGQQPGYCSEPNQHARECWVGHLGDTEHRVNGFTRRIVLDGIERRRPLRSVCFSQRCKLIQGDRINTLLSMVWQKVIRFPSGSKTLNCLTPKGISCRGSSLFIGATPRIFS